MISPELNQAQEERTRVPQDVDFDALLEVLVKARIPVEKFGIGGAKTVQHLLNEVADGESILSTDQSGNIYRSVDVLWMHVIYKQRNGDVYVLREDRQEFKDGRKDNIKRRHLESSLGEKLKPDEAPQEAVYRALAEELGVQDGIDELYELPYEEKTLTPDTYPGLESSYRFYKYAAVINEEAFNPDGYIEDQPDKTNYYVWELMYPKS